MFRAVGRLVDLIDHAYGLCRNVIRIAIDKIAQRLRDSILELQILLARHDAAGFAALQIDVHVDGRAGGDGAYLPRVEALGCEVRVQVYRRVKWRHASDTTMMLLLGRPCRSRPTASMMRCKLRARNKMSISHFAGSSSR